jgi:hypothetical protein
MRRLLAELLTMLLAANHVVAAQDATSDSQLGPGARVRVAYLGESARIGTLIALAPDTLVVRWADGAEPARLARAGVMRLDVSRGTRAVDRGQRAKYGFYIGAGIGLLLGAAIPQKNEGCDYSVCDDLDDLATGVTSLMLGGVGAAVGAATGRGADIWENVRLTPPRVGLVLPARGQGTGVSLSFAF